jgi:hypothetical protein
VIFVERISSTISDAASRAGEVWWVYAFALGAVAAFNPCGFALVPAYLGLYLRDDITRPGLGARLSRSVAVAVVVRASCIAEMPGFERVHRQLGDRIGFLGVSQSDARSASIDLARRTGITYPAGIDATGRFFNAWGTFAMPTTVFIRPGKRSRTYMREASTNLRCEV